MLHFLILWFMATVVPDQSKWGAIFCITTQLSTARSIYLETWICLNISKEPSTLTDWLKPDPTFAICWNLVPCWSKSKWSKAGLEHIISSPHIFSKALSGLPLHHSCSNGIFYHTFTSIGFLFEMGDEGTEYLLLIWSFEMFSSQIFIKRSLPKYLENALFPNILKTLSSQIFRKIFSFQIFQKDPSHMSDSGSETWNGLSIQISSTNQQTHRQGCRICGSVGALLPGTFYFARHFILKD